MSIRVMAQVWEVESLGPTSRLILLSLADHANDDGVCYPSIGRLCARTGISERAVQKHIKELVALGWLRIERNAGPRGCNVFTICTPAPDAPPHEVHPRTTCADPRTTCTPTPAPRAPEPSFNHQEPSEREAASPPPKRQAPRKRIPSDWLPSPGDIEFAESLGLSNEEISREADRFRDHHTAKGSVFADHSAAWRTWSRKAVEYAGGRMAGPANAPRGGGRSSIASAAARRLAGMGR